jgi:hypothetical protein
MRRFWLGTGREGRVIGDPPPSRNRCGNYVGQVGDSRLVIRRITGKRRGPDRGAEKVGNPAGVIEKSDCFVLVRKSSH